MKALIQIASHQHQIKHKKYCKYKCGGWSRLKYFTDLSGNYIASTCTIRSLLSRAYTLHHIHNNHKWLRLAQLGTQFLYTSLPTHQLYTLSGVQMLYSNNLYFLLHFPLKRCLLSTLNLIKVAVTQLFVPFLGWGVLLRPYVNNCCMYQINHATQGCMGFRVHEGNNN